MMLLRNRALLTLALAESISALGSWVTTMAVFTLIVFQRGGGAAESSSIFLAALLPMLVMSPLAGRLADRFDRRRILLGSELFSAIVVSGIIVADNLLFIYGLLALQACAIAVVAPARSAALPSLVPPEELTRANALLQNLAGIVKIGGPLLAGLLLTIVNPHTAIALDVASFIISAAILARLPALPPARAASEAKATAGVAAAGAPAARGQLNLLYVVAFATVLAIMGFDIFSALIVRDALAGDESLFGLLIGLVGIGVVAASAWLMLRPRQPSPWADMVVGLALLAALPAALAWALASGDAALGRTAVIVAALVGGMGNGLLLVQAGTLLQTLAPPALLGRAGGRFQIALVSGQLIALVVVPRLVPAIVPADRYFAGATAALLALAAAVAVATRATRRALPQATVSGD